MNRDEWLAHFAGTDVCLTEVHTPDEAEQDPHLVARRPPSPLRGSGETAPTLGADTDAALDQAGIGPVERARLRAAGII